MDAAQNFTELNAAIALAVNELGNLGNGIFPMLAMTDTQDSRQKVMQLMTLTPMFSAEDYEDPENVMLQEYRETLIAQLLKSGEKQAEAKRLADGLLQMEKALSEQASSMEGTGQSAKSDQPVYALSTGCDDAAGKTVGTVGGHWTSIEYADAGF